MVTLPDGRNLDASLVQVISRQIVLRSVCGRLLRLLHDASDHLFRVADQTDSWLSVSHCRASFLKVSRAEVCGICICKIRRARLLSGLVMSGRSSALLTRPDRKPGSRASGGGRR
jgi:hypothetical protein